MGRLEGDLHVEGQFTCGSLIAPANSIVKGAISLNAQGEPVNYDVIEHQHVITWGNELATAIATGAYPIHSAHAAGKVLSFVAGSFVIAVGAATVVVDLKKNNVTMLTATFTLDNANAIYVPEAGTIAGDGSYAAGELLTMHLTATAGGGTLPKGFFARLVVRENP